MLHLLLRYTQALITQMAQTAVCNRHHSLDQQLCRWLLLSLDRLRGNELVMTQELIANMLGVRREGVTEGAVKLQKAALDPLRRAATSRCSTARASKDAAASATPSSRRNTTACCRRARLSSVAALASGRAARYVRWRTVSADAGTDTRPRCRTPPRPSRPTN